jgi:hypothetical protein
MPKKRLPEIPIDPPREYFAAVGEVAVRWSRLEYQLGVLARVGFKLGKDEQRTLIIGMDMNVLTSVLRAVAQGWISDKNLAKDLRTFADDIAGLRSKRGDFVHGLYGYWAGKPQQWLMFKLKSPKQRGNINADAISHADIAAFAAKLRELQVRAQELTTALKAVHGTRP